MHVLDEVHNTSRLRARRRRRRPCIAWAGWERIKGRIVNVTIKPVAAKDATTIRAETAKKCFYRYNVPYPHLKQDQNEYQLFALSLFGCSSPAGGDSNFTSALPSASAGSGIGFLWRPVLKYTLPARPLTATIVAPADRSAKTLNPTSTSEEDADIAICRYIGYDAQTPRLRLWQVRKCGHTWPRKAASTDGFSSWPLRNSALRLVPNTRTSGKNVTALKLLHQHFLHAPLHVVLVCHELEPVLWMLRTALMDPTGKGS